MEKHSDAGNIENGQFRKMRLVNILLLFTLCFYLTNCMETDSVYIPERSEDCPEEVHFGSFNLSGEVLNFFPYQGLDKIVFTDSNSNEYSYTLSFGEITSASSSVISSHSACSYPYETTFTFDGEQYEIYLENEVLSHHIMIRHRVMNDHYISEEFKKADETTLFLSTRENDIHYQTALRMNYRKRGLDDVYQYYDIGLTFLDSVQINDKTFYDVYTYENLDDAYWASNYSVYINQEYGLVGIIYPENGFKLSFERFE